MRALPWKAAIAALVLQAGSAHSWCCQRRRAGSLLWCAAHLLPKQYLPCRQQACTVSQCTSRLGLQPPVLCSFPEAGAAKVDKTAMWACPRRWRCWQFCPRARRTSRPPLWPPAPTSAGQLAVTGMPWLPAQPNIAVFHFRQSSTYLAVMETEVKSLQETKGWLSLLLWGTACSEFVH